MFGKCLRTILKIFFEIAISQESNLEKTVLKIYVGNIFFKRVILKMSFFVGAILKMSYWKCTFERAILKMCYWESNSENVVLGW